MWKCKRCKIAKQYWKWKIKLDELTLPDFKIYCKATGTKIGLYWHKDRQIDQWNRIEPWSRTTHVQFIDLFFTKMQSQFNKKGFLTDGAGKIWVSICK